MARDTAHQVTSMVHGGFLLKPRQRIGLAPLAVIDDRVFVEFDGQVTRVGAQLNGLGCGVLLNNRLFYRILE
ncbi:MAG: hypothetical protein H2054_12195 [Sphingomonas sp.]|nr:hypothetical protein [Sphingomonas sp.]